MAELPEREPFGALPRVRFSPRSVDTGAAARGLGQLGGAVTSVSREMAAFEKRRAEAQRVTELTRLTAGATTELNTLELSLENDADFATIEERFLEGANEIFGRFSEAASDSQVRDLFEGSFRKLFEPKRVTLARGVFKREIDAATAVLDLQLAGYAGAAARAGSESERDQLLVQGSVAIAGMAAAGIITRVNAVAREAAFRSSADEALARRMITTRPDAAIGALLDDRNFRALDETGRARLIDMAAARSESLAKERARAEDAAERQAEKQQRAVAEEKLKEAYALDADGKLSRDFVDSIRPAIKPAEYKSLLKMLEPADVAVTDDPDAFRELQAALITNPDRAADLALDYHKAGLIGNETLKSVIGNGRSFARQVGPKSQYERSRELLWSSLDPGPLVDDPIQRQRQAEAVALFDKFAVPGRKDPELEIRGREIRDQFMFINLRDTMIGLPNPRFGAVPRDPTKPDAVAGALDAAEAETRRKFDAAEIDLDELAAEAEIFERWRAWLDRARASAGGGVK